MFNNFNFPGANNISCSFGNKEYVSTHNPIPSLFFGNFIFNKIYPNT